MPMPTWEGTGTVTGSTTTLTPTMPSGIAADDILLCINNSQSGLSTPTLSPANGFAITASSPQDPVVAGAAKMTVWWKRAVGSDSAPTISDTGDHNVAVVGLIRGCKTSGDPWNISSGGSEGDPTDTSLSITGATTTADNCLVVLIDGTGRNTSNNVSSMTNGDLATITERVDTGVSVGIGAYIIVYTGEKASAGAYGATTATLVQNDYKCFITLALEGAAATALRSQYLDYDYSR